MQKNVPFNAGISQYCNQPAHNVLTNPPNTWNISDGRQADNCSLTFGTETIPDQNYNVNRTVSVTLTEAYGGTPPLEYTLTPEMDIPDDLSFTTDTRTLTGTPTATATAVTLTYTVTDNADPMPATAELTFMVTVDKGDQTSFVFPDAIVRKIIEEDSSTFTVTVTDDRPGGGAVTYTSSDLMVATVDADTGEVTIVAIGETMITATKTADTNYNQATAFYTLIVTAAALPFRIKVFLEGAQ